MGMEELQHEILSDAEYESAAIITGAKKEAARIINQAEAEADQLANAKDMEVKATIEAIRRQSSANNQLEEKKIMMDAAKSSIDRTFNEAKKVIESLPEADRKRHVLALLKNASSQMDIGIVFCNSKDKQYVTGLEAKASQILGGIIVESKDGKVMLDYSYDTMLESIGEKDVQQISSILMKE